MKTILSSWSLPVLWIIVALVLTPNIAWANTIFVGTNFDIEASTPIAVGTTPLWAVTLTVVGKNGAEAGAFDGGQSGGGITTSNYSLHQVWEEAQIGPMVIEIPTPTMTLLGTYDDPPFPQDLDSHFLVDSTEGELVTTVAPNENKVTNSVEDSRAGFGNCLSGTFSLVGTTMPSWQLAYLVVPYGTEVSLDCGIGYKDGEGDDFVMESVDTSFAVIPEPSLLIILLTGIAFSALFRRR